MEILVVSDTHHRDWEEVHPAIRGLVERVDLTIHCGDFTNFSLVEHFQLNAKQFIGVHGNSDDNDLRQRMSSKQIITLEGLKFGITHPVWGGPPFELTELLSDFPETPDVILFGHLHEPINESHNGVTFVNPGQGYSSFLVPATIALLTVIHNEFHAKIETIEAAR